MITPFSFKETEIKGLIEVTPFNADDIRGSFTKDYSKEMFEVNGIEYNLAEVFYTTSHKGVIRAISPRTAKTSTIKEPCSCFCMRVCLILYLFYNCG